MTQRIRPRRHPALWRLLDRLRREATERLHDLRGALPTGATEAGAAEDEAVQSCAREVESTLAQMSWEMLRTIDNAMCRLERGGYGVCADCGRTIDATRLKALPFGIRCRACQVQSEAVEGSRWLLRPARRPPPWPVARIPAVVLEPIGGRVRERGYAS